MAIPQDCEISIERKSEVRATLLCINEKIKTVDNAIAGIQRRFEERIDQLQNEFQNEFQNAFKRGMIIMWSGSLHEMPEGWASCDGREGRPDLRNRFVIGAGNRYTIGQDGGKESHNHTGATGDHGLTEVELPPHSHLIGKAVEKHIVVPPTGNDHDYAYYLTSDGINRNESRRPNVVKPNVKTDDGNCQGSGHSHPIAPDSNIPPYYALAFIIKI